MSLIARYPVQGAVTILSIQVVSLSLMGRGHWVGGHSCFQWVKCISLWTGKATVLIYGPMHWSPTKSNFLPGSTDVHVNRASNVLIYCGVTLYRPIISQLRHQWWNHALRVVRDHSGGTRGTKGRSRSKKGRCPLRVPLWLCTGESILALGRTLVPRGVGVIQLPRHGVSDLQVVEEIDGCSGWGGGRWRGVGNRFVGVGRKRGSTTAKRERVAYLCQCNLGFQLSQSQSSSLLAKQEWAPWEPS